MSLLSKFVIDNLVPALEKAFKDHEPEMRAALLRELAAFSESLGEWIKDKWKRGIAENE